MNIAVNVPTGRHAAGTIVGILLALVPINVVVAIRADAWLSHHTGIPSALCMVILEWILIAVVLGYVAIVERRPLGSIGFRRPGWKTPLYALIAAVVMTVGISILVTAVFPLLHLSFNAAANAKLVALPFWQRVLLVLTAAIGEEVLFRGYPIERIHELTGNRWFAGVVSCAAFTYAHLGYWGWTQLIVAGFGGVVLTLLYIWQRNLPCNMFAHFLTDGAGLLLR
ncbi:MAG TPA: CPBP family intramembrane glutamic endopeptidase [Rhodanobacteraceae bacterium]